jgi:energy-converting hydrogenase Eha subunit G
MLFLANPSFLYYLISLLIILVPVEVFCGLASCELEGVVFTTFGAALAAFFLHPHAMLLEILYKIILLFINQNHLHNNPN